MILIYMNLDNSVISSKPLSRFEPLTKRGKKYKELSKPTPSLIISNPSSFQIIEPKVKKEEIKERKLDAFYNNEEYYNFDKINQ